MIFVILLQKYQNIEILCNENNLYLKRKLRTCTIHIQLKKVSFLLKKSISFYFLFFPSKGGPFYVRTVIYFFLIFQIKFANSVCPSFCLSVSLFKGLSLFWSVSLFFRTFSVILFVWMFFHFFPSVCLFEHLYAFLFVCILHYPKGEQNGQRSWPFCEFFKSFKKVFQKMTLLGPSKCEKKQSH